jgi:hypothetical protein
MLEICWVAEKLLASQEGLSSKKLFTNRMAPDYTKQSNCIITRSLRGKNRSYFVEVVSVRQTVT